jgi:hypothetical protein
MKNHELLDAVGGINPKHIATAEKLGKVGQKQIWKRTALVAACLCLVFAAVQILPHILGGRSGSGSQAGEHLSADGSSIFMSYEGPVLPLILSPEEDQASLFADRVITYDFYLVQQIPEGEKPNLGSVLVKDQYKVKNTGDRRSIKLLYPFVSSADELFLTAPRVLKDGEPVESRLYCGDFTGDFVPAGADQGSGETLNTEDLRDWQRYQNLLGTTAYLEQAQAAGRDLSQIPVTVYEFKKSYYPENLNDADHPTLVAGLLIDRAKTRILNLGFDGFLFREDGRMYYQYSMPQEGEPAYTDDRHYLILVGEDTQSFTIETQRSGGWDPYEEGNEVGRNDLEGAGVQVERLEMSLDEALDLALPHLYALYEERVEAAAADYKSWQPASWREAENSLISYEDFKRLYARDIFQYGILSENPVMRYDEGSLESLDTRNAQRIFFAAFELEAEAGEELNLDVETYKKGSMDFYGKRHNAGAYGYDLLNDVSHALATQTTQAEIIDYGAVEIVRQNFGFDLENDVKAVQLSDEIPHYYMEVQAKKKD